MGAIVRVHYSARRKVNKYKYVKQSIQRRKEWVDSFKKKPCLRCNIQFPTCAMDFHHVDPRLKKFNISGGAFRRSRKAILEEISKCILLCANCHRIVENVAGEWNGYTIFVS